MTTKIDATNPYSITPIGSCRIAGPLAIASTRYGFQLNKSKCYGYCHSALEALQYLRFLQGDYHSNSEIWPLISRSTNYDELKKVHHNPADLYVVEISSAKQISCRGHVLQLNYLRAHFADFFSDTNRAKAFWVAANSGTHRDFLSKSWTGTDRSEQRQILGDLNITHTTFEELSQSIAELKERAPRLLIVSHVDACRNDGRSLEVRQNLIQMLDKATRNLNVPFLNPTIAMQRVGQKNALQNDDLSLAHYTNDFEGRLADEIFLGGICDAIEDHCRHTKKPKIPSCLADLELSAKPELAALADIRIQRIRKRDAVASPNFPMKSDDVSGFVKNLFQGHPAASSEHFLRTARMLEYLGETDAAIFVHKHCVDHLPIEESCVAFLDSFGSSEFCDAIPFETLKSIVDNLDAERIARKLQNQSDLLALFNLVETDADRLNIGKRLVEITKKFEFSGKLEPQFRDQSYFLALVEAYLIAFQVKGSTSSSLWELEGIFDRLSASQTLSVNLTKTFGEIRFELTNRARALSASNKIEQLNEFFTFNQGLRHPIEEIEFMCCQLKYKKQELWPAVRLAQSITNRNPKKLNAWIILMRSANALNETPIAVDAARNVVSLCTKKDLRYTQEAQALILNERMSV